MSQPIPRSARPKKRANPLGRPPGDLNITVKHRTTDGVVLIEFGTVVSYIAFTPDYAMRLADMLRHSAEEGLKVVRG
jgi:hypothetical protein